MPKSINWTRSEAGNTDSRCGRFTIRRKDWGRGRQDYSLTRLTKTRETLAGFPTQAAAKAEAERIVDREQTRRMREQEAFLTKSWAEAKEKRETQR